MKRIKKVVLGLVALPMLAVAGCDWTQSVYNSVLEFIQGLGNA
jgi:hypothetical protein